ncbi:hypothetical protein NRB_18970 [Novosphingobium sp. 11B]|jgi:hypothetical protein|uniref:Uncharacterized protein n=1 Tax=Novosphingobium resinovorum TaxID=158500 RepID=A0A031K1E0_9SPHN|nr:MULTISPECIES: hypothetical protein [Sphingomonadaceae]AOR78992.1 hypothetical protein BES08_19020 [Novosphingobium resinovorum]EJU14203.1 hypothetical protein LH128_04843 [Sphingomonas sp. LH128]EZP82818.1 hypothetical protein BV97_01742 [Novosphingobium resinovorum]
MTEITRRTALAGIGIAGVGITGGVAGLVARGGSGAALRAVLHRLAGPFTMSDADFALFAKDFGARHGYLGYMEAGALHLLEVFGGARWFALRQPGIAERFDAFDRKLLTEFVLATRHDGSDDPGHLEYHGLFADNPCSNPFAQLG